MLTDETLHDLGYRVRRVEGECEDPSTRAHITNAEVRALLVAIADLTVRVELLEGGLS